MVMTDEKKTVPELLPHEVAWMSRAKANELVSITCRDAKNGKQEKWKEDAPNINSQKRDNTKESQILLWIWNCLGENSCFDFDQYVRDGVLFCRLMNYIKPNSIQGEIKTGGNLKQKRENIVKFLKAVQNYGITKELLFEPEDLLLLRNLPKVTRCLFALGKLSEADNSFKGPYLGAEPYEAANKSGRRRGGLPVGDDIYVAHVKLDNVIKQLHTPPKKIVDFYRPLIF